MAAYDRVDAAVRADPDSARARKRRNAMGPLFTERHETFARSTVDGSASISELPSPLALADVLRGVAQPNVTAITDNAWRRSSRCWTDEVQPPLRALQTPRQVGVQV